MIPRITVFLFIILFPLCLFCQDANPRIDSLLSRLEVTTDQEEQFLLSVKLWSEYINTDARLALKYAEDIIHIGQSLEADTIVGDGYYRKGVSHAYMNSFDSSGLYFRKSIGIFEKVDDYERIAGIQRNLGQDHNMVGNFDSASYYYQLSRENFASINDSVGMADIYNSEAVAYYAKGFYNLAFEKAVAGEEIFERYEGLDQELNQNRMVIASIYSAMKDTLNAIPYLKKTLDYFKANDMKRQYASAGVFLTDLLTPNYESYPEVFALVDEMQEMIKNLEAPSLFNQVQLAKATLAYERGAYTEARRIQAGLVAQTKGEGQEFLQAINTFALGKTLLKTGAYAEAIGHLKTSETLAQQLGIETIIRDAQKLLARGYEALGDYKNSLIYFKAFKKLDEKIYNEERTNRFSELQTIYENEKKESALTLQAEEIKTLNAQAKSTRLRSSLYATGMVSFILMSGLLFFGFRQRIKKNQIEREKQEVLLKQQLSFKKKELTSQTLHLVQKNTFIQEIKEKLEQIRQSPELFRAEFKKLMLLLRRQSAEDKTWEVFKSYFSEVHNDFDNQLKTVSGEVTENDIRLASFLRMNLSTKEIASLLNVLPDSVLKSKYRLKKKLQLAKEQDLGQFLSGL